MIKHNLLAFFLSSVSIFICTGASIDMVTVSGGKMKTESLDCGSTTVLVNDFKISRYETTNRIYLQFITETKEGWIDNGYWGSRYEISPTENHPAVYVSWIDAIKFCNWLSKHDGLSPVYDISGASVVWDKSTNGYRLPTSAEWEWAASGGSKSRKYIFSGSNNPIEVGVFENPKSTEPVGTKKANELGIYDMSGNVNEWCWDEYLAAANELPSVRKLRAEGVKFRILHGGSYNTPITHAPKIFDINGAPENSQGANGFRLAMNN